MTDAPMDRDLPCFPLLRGPTPLHEMPRLRRALGGPAACPRLLIKRDDLAGPALGGNKARKLEYVIGDARATGATHVITVGGVQSNHARLTAAAARLAGLGCVLVLTSESSEPPSAGNLLLDRLLGADIRFVQPGPVPLGPNPHEEEVVAAAAGEIEAAGGRPYVIPLGGSNELGTFGYADAVREIDRQLEAMDAEADRIYFAAGSRGTQAGLELGSRLNRSSWKAHGVAISPGDPGKTELAVQLVRGAAALVDERVSISPADVVTHQEHYGDGYGIPTAAGAEAIRLLARTEAVLLDPTYTAKAMAGMIDHVRRGEILADQTVLFLHTGGAPGLFAAEAGALTD